jgi:C_GCAxxG_C_C family probable redox protein
MDREEIIARVKKRARDNFKTGLNCSECVFEALLTELFPDLPPETLSIVTGFGGGCGLYGDTCGALLGAMAGVGLAYGRRGLPEGDLAQSKAELYGKPGLYRVFNRLPNELKKRWGSTMCRELSQKWHDSWLCREHALQVREIIGEMAELAAEMIVPKDLEHWGTQPLGDNVEGIKEE